MDFSKELLFSFSAIGVLNSIVLSFYFFFFADPKHRSHRFLGLLLFFLSIRIGKSVFFYFNDYLSDVYIQIGLTACWFLGPLLYFYVKVATSEKKVPDFFWLPHILVLAPIAIYINLNYPWSTSLDFWRTYFFVIDLEWLLYLVLSGTILINTFKKKEISSSNNSSFKFWILSIYFGNVIIWLSYVLTPYTSYILGAVTFSVIFYLLLIMILRAKKRKSLLLLNPPKYGNTQLDTSDIQNVVTNLKQMMDQDELFKDPNISLKEVAKRIGITPHKLSQILNINMKQSFPNVLGEYRIEAAKKMIAEMPNYSIESIGYECGFNSKSSFYNVFKKHTGMTPFQFKKEIIE